MRSVDVIDKDWGIILLGVGLSFATVPIVDFEFATRGLGFAERDILGAFAGTRTVVDVVVRGEVRGTLPGVLAVLGFSKIVVVDATSNPGVTEVEHSGYSFLMEPSLAAVQPLW